MLKYRTTLWQPEHRAALVDPAADDRRLCADGVQDIFPKGSAGRDLMKEFHFMGGSADPGAGGRAPAGARG